MNVSISQTIKKVNARRRAQAKDLRREIDQLREAITKKSGRWNSTKILRDIRDGR